MSIGERLREERTRLGCSQSAFGEIGGVQKQAQLKYEKDERKPDADYLQAIARVGADVRYIVTGERDYSPPPPLSRDEAELVELYRAAPLAVRLAATAALASSGGKYAGATVGAVHEKAPKKMTIKQEFNKKDK